MASGSAKPLLFGACEACAAVNSPSDAGVRVNASTSCKPLPLRAIGGNVDSVNTKTTTEQLPLSSEVDVGDLYPLVTQLPTDYQASFEICKPLRGSH